MDPKRLVSALLCSCIVCSAFQAIDCFAQKSTREPTAVSQFQGVTIQRFGGFSGAEEEWFFSDRGVRLTAEGPSLQVPVVRLDRLRELVARNERSSVSQTPRIPTCFDCFRYRIIVWYDDGHQTLEIVEAGGKSDAQSIEVLGLVRCLTSDRIQQP